MLRSLFSRIIFFLLIITVVSFGLDKEDSNKKYEKTLEQLKSGKIDINFKEFRLSCADSKYSCEADSDDVKKIRTILENKKFEEGLKIVNKSLEKTFVDIDLHYFAFIANMELKNTDKADFHKSVLRGLLDSIQENKHGKSEDDAFVVINVHEEYVFLRFSNMRPKSQSLSSKDGHSFDVMKCEDMRDHSELTVYFDVDISMNKLNNLFKK